MSVVVRSPARRRRARWGRRSPTCRRRRKSEVLAQAGNTNAPPAPPGQVCAQRRESPMNNLDASGFKKLCYRHEVLIGRNQHRNVVVVGPGQADHVRSHPEIDTLLFGASHVRTASGAGCHFDVACGAARRGALLLPWDYRNAHSREAAHFGCRPSKQFPVLISVWIVGAVEIQPLVLTRTSRSNELGCRARQHRPEPGPVRAEVRIDIPHGERVVPEVDEHPYTMALRVYVVGRWTGHGSGVQKYRDAQRRPWGHGDRPPLAPVWAAIRWALLKAL